MRTLISTFPKTGTHLLKQIVGRHSWAPSITGATSADFLADLGVRPRSRLTRLDIPNTGPVVMGHIGYTKEVDSYIRRSDVDFLLLIRDPRDTLVSHYHSVRKGNSRYNFELVDGGRLSEKEDLLLWCIKLAGLWWKGWTPWIEKDIPKLILRYEELRNVETIELLSEFIPDFSVEEAMNRIDPPKSPTFRRGLVGDWKLEFKSHHIELAKEVLNDAMAVCGYRWEDSVTRVT